MNKVKKVKIEESIPEKRSRFLFEPPFYPGPASRLLDTALNSADEQKKARANRDRLLDLTGAWVDQNYKHAIHEADEIFQRLKFALETSKFITVDYTNPELRKIRYSVSMFRKEIGQIETRFIEFEISRADQSGYYIFKMESRKIG